MRHSTRVLAGGIQADLTASIQSLQKARMFEVFLLSVRQFADRAILMILLKVIGLTLALFAIFGIAAYLGLVWLLASFGWNEGGFFAAATAAILAVLIAIFLFRVIAIFVLNIFSDDIVEAVERQHYPVQAETANPPSYALGVRMGLASVGRALGYNFVALPVYLLLLITGIGAPLAFFAINAILLGRDLQDMVIARHATDFKRIATEWQLPKTTRFLLGLVTALLMAVPFVNFLAPVLGAAMATHLVHRKGEGSKS